MAFVPNRNLFLTSNETLRDYQHAARLFTDGQFALAPKFKFLYHVVFGLNSSALTDISLKQLHNNEINMLVKNVELPNFEIKVENLNQYNRRKNIQYRHNYKPLSITFHDDNLGVINNLWKNYYSYYYADPTSATVIGAYNRNATKKYSFIPTSYGLDNGSTLPFFTHIKMYQLARHEYTCYTLYNPIISSWNHNKLSYEENKVHDNVMTIEYEAVSYSYGQVNSQTQEQFPEGFAKEHYDNVPSPIQGSQFEGVSSPSFVTGANDSITSLGNIIESINSYQNTTNPTQIPNTPVISSVISNSPVSGITNTIFPQSSTGNNTVTAVPKTF